VARIARIVAADIPHHITQRGNRRQETFFQDEDYRLYLNLMAEWCNHYNVEVLAAEVEEQELKEIRKHECTGRPLGNVSFLERLESELGRTLQRRKPGPKTKNRKN
jgi:hypothetical protein